MPSEYDLHNTFVHKAIRDDMYDFWPDFCGSILGGPHEPLRDVPTNNNLFGYRLGRAYQVGVEPQFTPQEKSGFSKPQSTSVVAPKADLWTPIFGHVRNTTCLVGMRFAPEENLANSYDLYDAGSVHALHRRFTSREEAQNVANIKLADGCSFDNIEALIQANARINNGTPFPQINEAKFRLKMTCSPANQITIGEDNLESRLLAQVRAQDLYRHMKKNMPLPSTYKFVPISFYVPKSKKIQTYTHDEQSRDLVLAVNNSSNRVEALALFAKLSEDNFENSFTRKVGLEQVDRLFGELLFIASKLTHSTSILFFDKIVLPSLSLSRIQDFLGKNACQATNVYWKNIFTMLPLECREAFFYVKFKEFIPNRTYASVKRGYLLAEMWRRDLSTEKVAELKLLMKRWSHSFLADELNNQLISASKKGMTHTVDILICAGSCINLNVKDSNSYTPITHASDHGHTEVVKSLLEAGAVISGVRPFRDFPLYWAANAGNTAIVILLLNKNKNKISSVEIKYALRHALSQGHIEVVGLLMTTLSLRKKPLDRYVLDFDIARHLKHGQLYTRLLTLVNRIGALCDQIDQARQRLEIEADLFNCGIFLKAFDDLASISPAPWINDIHSEIQTRVMAHIDGLFLKNKRLFLNPEATLFNKTYDYVRTNKPLEPMFLHDVIRTFQDDLKNISVLVAEFSKENDLKKLIDIFLLLPESLVNSGIANTFRDAIRELLSKKSQDNELYFLTDEFFAEWQRTSGLLRFLLSDLVRSGRHSLNLKLHSIIDAKAPELIENWLQDDEQSEQNPASIEAWVEQNRRFGNLYPGYICENFFNCLNSSGENIILSAVKTGNLSLVQTVFNEIPKTSLIKAMGRLDSYGNSALKWVASFAYIDVLDFILEKYVELCSPEERVKAIFHKNKINQSAFQIAVIEGHADVTIHFIQTIQESYRINNYASLPRQVEEAIALNADIASHPVVQLQLDSMHLDFALLSIKDLISNQIFSTPADVKFAVEILFNKMIENTEGVVRENLQQYKVTLLQDFDKTWRFKNGVHLLVDKDYYENMLLNYEHIIKYKSLRDAIDAIPGHYDITNLVYTKQVTDMLSNCEQFLTKDSCDYYKKINTLSTSQSLKKKAGMLAGSMIYVLGVSIFVVLGFSVGLAVGAIIGGGVGSVAPVFGNLAGAIASGAVGAVVGALKAASLGAVITAGVCSAMGIKVGDKLLPSVSTLSNFSFLNEKQKIGNVIKEGLSSTIEKERYKPVAAPAL